MKSTSITRAHGYDMVAKHFILGAFFTTTQWAKDHPELVEAFASAIHETAV